MHCQCMPTSAGLVALEGFYRKILLVLVRLQRVLFMLVFLASKNVRLLLIFDERMRG
jgi:hypothetical protein